jgi:hypothetical protein
MPDITLLPIFAQDYDVGRMVLLLANPGTPPDDYPQYWDGTAPIKFEHGGNTEGKVAPAANTEFSDLTLPENTGPAIIKRYVTGHKPTFTFDTFADPRRLRIFTPTGSASGGQERQRLAKAHTVWLAPEQLFIKRNADGTEVAVSLNLNAGTWTKDGDAFTAEDQRLFDLSTFFWKVMFDQLMIPYSHDNGGKANVTVTATVMGDFTKPDGHQLWTNGQDLATSGVDLEGDAS